MIANLHTHTWRCNHAKGRENEYVDNAVAAGLQILGFSDHTPYLFPNGYRSGFRMEADQLDDYVQTVLALRRDYAGQLQIPLGLEIEYYPAWLPDLLPLLKDQPLDYLILGQHFIGNEINEPYCGFRTDDKRILERYTDQSIEALQTGMFTYFAHPDLLRFTGDHRFYFSQAQRLCREAVSCGIPLEINLLGIREQRHYPRPQFWEAAAEEGCTVVLGRDAHQPEALLDTASEQTALEMVRFYGLQLQETVPLRKPF